MEFGNSLIICKNQKGQELVNGTNERIRKLGAACKQKSLTWFTFKRASFLPGFLELSKVQTMKEDLWEIPYFFLLIY